MAPIKTKRERDQIPIVLRNNFRNIVHLRHPSDNGQCPR